MAATDTIESNPQAYSDMMENARAATELLKALSNETRLMILCMLADGERSVSEMETMLDMRQPTVSQQLARLRADRLVATRRDGKTIYYKLASTDAKVIIDSLHQVFCAKNCSAEVV